MLSAQVIRNSIESLQRVTNIELFVYEPDGKLIAGTSDDTAGELPKASVIESFAESDAESLSTKLCHLFKADDEMDTLYIIAAKGRTEGAHMAGAICVNHLRELMTAYREPLDRGSFFQNLLLDNLLLVDVYNRARQLHITDSVKRAVFVVETEVNETHDNPVSELLHSMFMPQTGDYVTAIDESTMIVIKALGEDTYLYNSTLTSPDGMEDSEYARATADTIGDIPSEDDVCQRQSAFVATSIIDMINAEVMIRARVAYGTVVDELKDLSRSYKEASMALEVGRIFYEEKYIHAYRTLGIGRLIYQLPVSLCRMYLNEVFGSRDVFELLDEETITTANEFFKDSLNVSETARALYIHRNTLVYRLDKMARTIGLDIRNFDDAMAFRVAFMVARYLRHLDGKL